MKRFTITNLVLTREVGEQNEQPYMDGDLAAIARDLASIGLKATAESTIELVNEERPWGYKIGLSKSVWYATVYVRGAESREAAFAAAKEHAIQKWPMAKGLKPEEFDVARFSEICESMWNYSVFMGKDEGKQRHSTHGNIQCISGSAVTD